MSVSKRAIAIWIIGVFLAGAAGVNALGNVMQKRNPMLAMQVASGNGVAKAEAADLLVQSAIIQNKGEMPDTLPDATATLARDAFLSEPLAAEAPRVLAFYNDTLGPDEKQSARALMRMVPKVSKRETAANIWLSEDYAVLGDDARALYFFDLTMRVSTESTLLLLPRLVEIASRDDAIRPLANLLEADPPWLDQFWREAVKQVPRAQSVAKLRRLTAPPDGMRDEVDRQLLANLVQQQQFGEASRLAAFLAGRQASSAFVSNFDTVPAFPPFDWELINEGGYGAFVDEEEMSLLLSASPGEQGVAARRLLPLQPGRYAITLSDVEFTSPEMTLEARTRCPDNSVLLTHALSADGDDLRAEWQVDSPPCEFYWLEIRLELPTAADPVDASITKIELTRS